MYHVSVCFLYSWAVWRFMHGVERHILCTFYCFDHSIKARRKQMGNKRCMTYMCAIFIYVMRPADCGLSFYVQIEIRGGRIVHRPELGTYRLVDT